MFALESSNPAQIFSTLFDNPSTPIPTINLVSARQPLTGNEVVLQSTQLPSNRRSALRENGLVVFCPSTGLPCAPTELSPSPVHTRVLGVQTRLGQILFFSSSFSLPLLPSERRRLPRPMSPPILTKPETRGSREGWVPGAPRLQWDGVRARTPGESENGKRSSRRAGQRESERKKQPNGAVPFCWGTLLGRQVSLEPGGLTPDLDQTPKVGDETWGRGAPASQQASQHLTFYQTRLAESCGASLLSQKGKANTKRLRSVQDCLLFRPSSPLFPPFAISTG